jgi:hypothetical protein
VAEFFSSDFGFPGSHSHDGSADEHRDVAREGKGSECASDITDEQTDTRRENNSTDCVHKIPQNRKPGLPAVRNELK